MSPVAIVEAGNLDRPWHAGLEEAELIIRFTQHTAPNFGTLYPEQEQRLLRHIVFAHRGWTTLSTREPEKYGTDGGETDQLDHRKSLTDYLGLFTSGEYDGGFRLVKTTNNFIIEKHAAPRYGSRRIEFMMKNMHRDAVRRRSRKYLIPQFNAENDWEILRMFDDLEEALAARDDREELSRYLRSPLVDHERGRDITAKLFLGGMYTSLFNGRTEATLITHPRVSDSSFLERDCKIKTLGPVVTLDKEEDHAITVEYSAQNVAAFERAVRKTGSRMPRVALDFMPDTQELLVLEFNDGNPKPRIEHLDRRQLVRMGLIADFDSSAKDLPQSRTLRKFFKESPFRLATRLEQCLVLDDAALSR